MATLDEFAEVAVATLKKSMKTPTSSIADVNTLLRKLKEKGNIKSSGGGTFITEPTTLVENSTLKNYYGYEPGNIGASENLKEARYPKAQKMMHISASGREMRANTGDEKLFDFVDAKIEAARQTASNRMNIELYGDGSVYQSILGLQTFVAATSATTTMGAGVGAGTYGGIDSSVFTRWQNKTWLIDKTAITGANVQAAIDGLKKLCTDGEDSPDMGILSMDLFNLIEADYRSKVRYDGLRMDPKAANVGVPSLYHAMIPIYWDINTSFGTTAQLGYLLDTKNISLLEDPKAKWTFGKPEKPVGGDSVVIMGIWEGQKTCKKRRTQGRIGVQA